MKALPLIFWLSLFASCNSQDRNRDSQQFYDQKQFRDYWYSGKAEITSFKLEQSRYRERRNGTAVLIFVTEDFSLRKQVKLDQPENATGKVSMLKMNMTKNFVTGIYPYSMMLSVFTPIERNRYASTLKVTGSIQEWCGQVYTQMNLKGNRYVIKSHSYFEEESDKNFSIRKVWLEDEIWNVIRLNYKSLPIGSFKILPGLFFTRLNHTALSPEEVSATLDASGSTVFYKLQFQNSSRSLTIEFDKNFPFQIAGWQETWMESNTRQETKATRIKTLYTDYWTKNKNEYRHLRDSLSLDSHF